MSAPTSRFFELAEHHGLDHTDNPAPLAEIGLSVPIPVMTPEGPMLSGSGTVVIQPGPALSTTCMARIVPDTRIVETNSDLVMAALIGHGYGHEIGSPTKAHLAKHHGWTRAHQEALKARDAQVVAGNEPAPDAADHPTDNEGE